MRHPVRLGIALTLALAAAGCSAAAGGGSDDAGGSTAPSGTNTTAGSGAAKAVSVTSCGRELSFSGPPKRTVALDQTSTETLLELGLQDRMAGTANLKTKIPAVYEAAYATVPVIAPKIATGEQLRAATPDFVVAGSTDLYTEDRAGSREELEALKVPTFVSAVDCPEHNPPGTTPFELLFSDYENLGKLFGAEKRAAELTADQRAAVAGAGRNAAKVPGAPTGRPSSTSTRSSTACRTWRAARASPAR